MITPDDLQHNPSQKQSSQQIISAINKLCQARLISGSSGNVSCRYEDGFLITPSAVGYEDLKAEMIVYVDMDGNKQGDCNPSSEWRIHRDLYAINSATRAVIHTHSMYCSILACSHREIPSFHYMVAIAGGKKIPCAQYATFGTKQLSDNIIDAIDGYKACIMANHGAVFTGADLNSAFDLAVEIEQLAQQYCELLKIGEIQLVDDAEMDIILEKFNSYKA
ncbi:MAG: class II aldolase [Gammaproteobacteria bacterium]|nr:MAG: class II aldolase [Gammaproteobacteria bacterium]